ncbi:Glycoside hydrolase family 63 protein [Mycena indigotica]|uniref:Glycoside hydrolase family 63 protein n=1 Tax=Mycena indigotica TaxID=2126181 RepID=A0A8H6SR00_9AGAR|nr:Glycoside hydrolase family 63 protein [Mycena indigotica]KAF7303608.1 Glycoside hydrolase family 63 protein [Mycena indigotica]
MASDSVKKVQGKLFGRSSQPDAPAPLESVPTPPLTIDIPKPLSSSQPTLPPKPTKTSTQSQYPEEDKKTWRERLAAKLGADYKGAERYRLLQDENSERHWKRWGPYVSDRQWATVREDYSDNGDAWNHFPHEHARSRAYRWGEDGLAGVSDNHQRLCLSVSLWNEQDPILKERLFGVTGHQGNHGEDVKELYYYLDSTPTHSYMKFLYKYPQKAFPYEQLVSENQNRNREVTEYEILDTDVFDEDRYWDVFVEYAKDEDEPDNLYLRITAYNRGPDPASLHIIPQLWFPNTWSWPTEKPPMPSLTGSIRSDVPCITAKHPSLGKTHLFCLSSPPPVDGDGQFVEGTEAENVEPDLLFTENDTNYSRLYGGTNDSPYVKDAFHDHIIPQHRPLAVEEQEKPFAHKIRSRTASTFDHESVSSAEEGPVTPFPPTADFVNPEQTGTKSAAHYHFHNVPGHGGCAVVRVKLTPSNPKKDPSLVDEMFFDDAVESRRQEADEFYGSLVLGPVSEDLKQITRQALAGMMWSKQYYQFIQKEWISGDPAQPPPPPQRKYIRNRDWRHMHVADVLSMPDKWEYPFFAAWDTAFHCIPLALVDPAFAKKQLELLTREWYMKPDGQIPAYEWNFGDVNPPVHAWSTFRVFKIERKMTGKEDLAFLERVFQKLLLNFTWWVNRKDKEGSGVFEGGFLGLDNIGVFNRSEPLPTGGDLRQADGTAWMAFYCLNMLNMALELAKHNPVYEDIASKFFEHFIYIADAMTYRVGDENVSLWNEEDGFYYDAIHFGPGNSMQLPVRSLVGLIPLYATLVLEPSTLNRFPGFKKRLEWFIDNRPHLSARNMANMKARGKEQRLLMALASKERLVKILERMLDESEFFSEYGIRSLSKYHKDHPWGMDVNGQRYEVNYWPGDSKSGMFGGNSNWRGPTWLATTFLLIESLQRFYQYYGDDLQVECPTGSGDYMNLVSVAEEIQHRIIHIFGRDADGRRATNGGNPKLDHDPHFRDYVWFYEFFHADDGRGLGASHQTGWTGLVAYHILQSGMSCRLPKTPRTPRAIVRHYFDETIDSRSEFGDDNKSQSAFSMFDLNTLGDLSPDALIHARIQTRMYLLTSNSFEQRDQLIGLALILQKKVRTSTACSRCTVRDLVVSSPGPIPEKKPLPKTLQPSYAKPICTHS